MIIALKIDKKIINLTFFFNFNIVINKKIQLKINLFQIGVFYEQLTSDD